MPDRLHLDVPSALETGLTEAFSDFRWPVPQSHYDSISHSFINTMEGILSDSSISPEDQTSVALSIYPIVHECFYFACSYVNILACENESIDFNYSANDLFYPTIHRFRTSESPSIDSSLAEIESSPSMGVAKRFLRNIRTQIRLVKLALLSKLTRPRKYRITSNTLERESQKPNDVPVADLIHGTKRANDYISTSQPHGEISRRIATEFCKVLSTTGYTPDQLITEYFLRVSTFHLNLAKKSQNKKINRFLNTENSFLISGTAGGFQSRMMSWLFQSHNLPVVRFTHGGERGLMSDMRWHYPELMFADHYVVHGPREAEQVRDAVIQKTTSRTASNLKIHSVGSGHHQKIRERSTSLTQSDSVEKVMVVTNSFTSERRSAFTSTGEDVVYLEWHLRLLNALKATDFHISSKRHPKGNLTETRVLGDAVDQEILSRPFTEILFSADAFVFDFAASAFMEAMCTNKPVVLVEFPHRRLSDASRDDVAAVCTLVPAEYDDRNRIQADFDHVIKGITRKVDISARQKFLEEYLLYSADGLPKLFE
tara:strand:- start:2698 stop:4323 length:1626 start_codon:yes stop_codon:yes gene_type:complete